MQDQPDDIKVIRNAVNPPSILNDPDSLSYTENRSLSLIDVNTAGHEELEQLPMIGHSRALAIIAYREEHGQFKSIEELTNVSGIGPGIFQKIKSNITVQQTETGNTESK
ncbi:MAG: helix-hairpin-helix domain-containing protein [Candidatus Latescibacteria bacterium]|nr:helix-hairpin-helix domain-containing protein [Candidatus Latescibacterota bacterium]